MGNKALKKSAKKKTKSSKDARISELQNLLEQGAQPERPKQKTWSLLDMRGISPKNANQKKVFDGYQADKDLVLAGSPGTGKTLLALYLGLNSVLQGLQKRVIIVRTTVPGRDMGHLPGTEAEKLSPYERPYQEALQYLFKHSSTYDDMKEAGIVVFESTAFLRSITHSDSVIIFDEAQNSLFEEINTVNTRLGKNSRIIMIGDTKQTDLNPKKEKSGFPKALQIMGNLTEDFDMVTFTSDDIIRSERVKRWVKAVEQYEVQNED